MKSASEVCAFCILHFASRLDITLRKVTIDSTSHSAYYTLLGIFYILHSAGDILHITLCWGYSTYYTLTGDILHITLCWGYSAYYTLLGIFYTLHSAGDILHITLSLGIFCILHSAGDFLHITLCWGYST